MSKMDHLPMMRTNHRRLVNVLYSRRPTATTLSTITPAPLRRASAPYPTPRCCTPCTDLSPPSSIGSPAR